MNRIIVLLSPVLVMAFSYREIEKSSFLDDLPTKELPYIESTNCSIRNNELRPILNETQIKTLGLKKLFAGRDLIYSDPRLAFADSVSMRYRLNLSDKFKTVVLSCYDWRVYTILINYKNEFDVIDFELIAFDFVDERNFRISSIINKDKLEITQTKGLDDSTTTIYKIEPDGIINKASR
jgi:hypothetical protein